MDDLSPNERRICKELTEKMLSRNICKAFDHPINELDENVPDYYQKIKNPMDLGTVNRKLNNKMYRNVAEWISDVETIWLNAMKFNKEGTPFHLIALEMQSWFRKQVSKQAWNTKTGITDIKDAIDGLLIHIHRHS